MRMRPKMYKQWLSNPNQRPAAAALPSRQERRERNGRERQLAMRNVPGERDENFYEAADVQEPMVIDVEEAGHDHNRVNNTADTVAAAEQIQNQEQMEETENETERVASTDSEASEQEENNDGSDISDQGVAEPEAPCDCFHCQDETHNRNEEGGEEEDFGFSGAESYAAKLQLHELLTPLLSITKFEVLTMILTIAMRHGMTGPLISDLLKFVNTIVGVESLPSTSYVFNKIFSVDSSLKYHFVCSECNLYLGEHKSFASSTIECLNCEHACNVKPSTLNEGTFFVTLSVRDQLQKLVERSGQHFVSREQRIDDGCIRDIYDGKLYKSLCEEGNPLSNPNALSLTIGTDGGQVFQNSSRNNSMWPIQAFCNELCPTERFRPENMILAGLWFGKSSPEMSAFMKPLSEELKSMEIHGVKRLHHGQPINCPVYTIMCVCDSVAKPKVQNITQFNGYFGCGYCLQRGELDDECTTQVRFPFDGTKYPLRSEESVREAMTLAQETAITEYGVKGLSSLLLFNTMHLVFGVPIDYMHAILLGVVKKLTSLWFDDAKEGKRYYIKKFESDIDNLLADITLPSGIATRPKLISKRAHWKAKDYACFLLIYGLPCLEKYLPSVYYRNFRDLSNGIFLLLKDNISPEDLIEADNLLNRFLKTFNDIYGKRNMVYNLHLVSHLVQIVKLCGPLPMFSAFAFEGGIGLLAKLVKGTNSVASQICRKYVVSKSLPHLLNQFELAISVNKFCEETLTYTKIKYSISADGMTLLGKAKLHFLSPIQREVLQQHGWAVGEYADSYHRTIYKGKVTTSRAYSRPQKTNDTCVQLISGVYGLIDVIIFLTEPRRSCVILLTPLRICPQVEYAKHIIVCAGNPFAQQIAVTPSDIAKKCMFFFVGTKKFVSFRANEFERD